MRTSYAEALAAAEGERRRWSREPARPDAAVARPALRVAWTAQLQGGSGRLASVGREAIGELEAEIANLRGIIQDLRPPVLDDLGLATALHALAERCSTDDLSVECELSPPEPVLGAELDTTVYRLIQEALTNITKHAHATRATVSLLVRGGRSRCAYKTTVSALTQQNTPRGTGWSGCASV